jgi:hypothetical protein
MVRGMPDAVVEVACLGGVCFEFAFPEIFVESFEELVLTGL